MPQDASKPTGSRPEPQPPIAAIRADAADRAVLRRLLRGMPPDTGIGFVVVQAPNPRHPALTAELIGAFTTLPVVAAGDGLPVAANRIHVVAPDTAATIVGGHLQLSASSPLGASTTGIDRFFSSLADDRRGLAIGVLLSDACIAEAQGIARIKARGGLLVAQAGTRPAEFADQVSAVEEIPAALLRHLTRPAPPAVEGRLAGLLEQTLLARFTPAALLIDARYRILHRHGPVADYLGPSVEPPEDDLLGRLPEDYRERLRAVLDRALVEGIPASATVCRMGPGTRGCAVQVTATPLIEVGQPDLVLVTFADVAAPQETERHCRATLERLERHFDSTPVAALEWSPEARILGWSPAAERIFGWRKAEVLGRPLEALDLIDETDRPAVTATIAALLAGSDACGKIVTRNRRKDGGAIWCEWHNSVLRDTAGRPVSVLSLAMDVTERQTLEANLRRQAARLAEADRRKDEFLSMLGHELRNPLAPMRHALEVAGLRRDDPPTTQWALQIIDRQTRHLGRLVDDLLDVARITRGAIQLRCEPIDLAAIAHEALESAGPMIRARGHRLEDALPMSPLPMRGDATRLTQIIANLLHNASKYTDEGGTIRIALVADGGQARLTIEDDGRGIEPDALPFIFDAFRQGRGSATPPEGGLGVGLTLVKRLVELHAGTVAAESAGRGRGSRFVVTLPLEQDAEGAAPTTETPTDAAAGAKKHVLIVDDNPEILDASRRLLVALGHTVSTAGSGLEALELVRRSPPDVVLLDIGLDDIDGIEVARRLAELPQRPMIRVVALSGYPPNETRHERGLFDDYLLKPAGMKALQGILG